MNCIIFLPTFNDAPGDCHDHRHDRARGLPKGVSTPTGQSVSKKRAKLYARTNSLGPSSLKVVME